MYVIKREYTHVAQAGVVYRVINTITSEAGNTDLLVEVPGSSHMGVVALDELSPNTDYFMGTDGSVYPLVVAS